jgi:steroid delta-isomerase-like uncharacterized protein
MSDESMSRLVRAWAECWSSGVEGLERFLALFHDDASYEDVAARTVCHGKEQITGFYRAVFAAAPDHKLEPLHIVVQGDRAAAEWIGTGTSMGGFPGIPPTGKGFTLRGMSSLERREGKLTRVVDYWDLLSSGFLPSAPP